MKEQWWQLSNWPYATDRKASSLHKLRKRFQVGETHTMQARRLHKNRGCRREGASPKRDWNSHLFYTQAVVSLPQNKLVQRVNKVATRQDKNSFYNVLPVWWLDFKANCLSWWQWVMVTSQQNENSTAQVPCETWKRVGRAVSRTGWAHTWRFNFTRAWHS